MIFRVVLICLLSCCGVRADRSLQRFPRKIDSPRPCDFDEYRKNYDANDLLGCIDELAVDLADRESGRYSSDKDHRNDSTGRQISFMDIFSSFFNGNPAASHQGIPFPASPISGQQQANYPTGTLVPAPGFQLNLLDALSTISRHDDYKCVPRILCEMASGKLPGRSLGKQGSGFFDFLGQNSFTDWLAGLDVAGVSPLLNFGRAMILGYSNRGNSATCYQAFPKCPKTPNELVYYLNNYRGGFFRLFNSYRGGNYKRNNGIPGQGVTVKERVVTGSLRDYFPDQSHQGTIQFPVGKYPQYFDDTEAPRFDEIRNSNDIIFPGREAFQSVTIAGGQAGVPGSGSFSQVREQLEDDPTAVNIQNDLPEWSSVQYSNDVPFFPRERGGRKLTNIRFPSDFQLPSTD